MQGILLAELEKYIDAKWGDATWLAVLDEAGLDGRNYTSDGTYPDADLVAVIRAVPSITPVPLAVLAEDFGAYLAPVLVRRYAGLLQPEWRTLDVMANSEPLYLAISEALFGVAATVMRGVRGEDGAVQITYASHRRLCALIKGLARGLGAHFGEAISVEERACMHRGAQACEIRLTGR
jgi:hypothetical protein